MAERLLSTLGIAAPFLVIVAIGAVVVVLAFVVMIATEPDGD